MVKPKLLIVEDDEGLCSQYRWAFPAYDVILSHTRQHARALAARDDPPVVIMDLGLPPDPHGVSEGFATLEEFSTIAPRSKIIVVTCHAAARNAPRAFTLGAFDFHEKPVGIEVLRTIVDRAMRPAMEREAEPRFPSPLDRFIAASSSMLNVYRGAGKRSRAVLMNANRDTAAARDTRKNAVRL